MKTHTVLVPIASCAGIILLLAFGCARRDSAAQARDRSAAERAAPTQPSVPAAKPVKVAPVAGNSPPAPVTASWAAIKDLGYEQRAGFLSGAGGLEAILAGQISELNAKRASMTAEAKDWDFAMKELNDAHSYLKSVIQEAGRASPETWDQEKDKVGEAWQRAQDACDKVRMSTTS